jgi:alpha-glucuronidase
MRTTRILAILLCIAFLASASATQSQTETGSDAWLRYAPLDAAARGQYKGLPGSVVTIGDSAVVHAAQQEFIRGMSGMLDDHLHAEAHFSSGGAFILGTFADVHAALPAVPLAPISIEDGYSIQAIVIGGHSSLLITAINDRGVLYGVFALLRKIALGSPITQINELQIPYAPIRWVNEWDNLDGTIERGYSGRSVFFENGHVLTNLSRASDYARLLASLGINGCAINNVNADSRILTPEFIPQLARVAAAFRPWGVRLAVAVDISSPKSIGGLATFDPLDPGVAEWWRKKADEIYAAIPDFGGFVLKADSEGRVGPSAYGRTHADGANLIARALKPHGGLLFYRGFVYDHHLDWRNLKNDRARAAYDNFYKLDGQFDANVILQIKNGPIDFQVREPASPLFGALNKTNEAIELQITQEYTGQARHLCFLVPMWKEVLDFDMHAAENATPVKALVAGKVFHLPTGGFVGVSNVGSDPTWLGNHLSVANLYGFGRLAWNPDLTSKEITDEWTRLTFGNDSHVVETIGAMQLSSWRTYENYTGPLGAGTLTDITGNHYGPSVEASERNGWGQWHRADANGIGMDRTVATGTGYIGQYQAPVAKLYESLADCPDELLLFFHHVPYTYVLHSGKTVIQHIYDSHYEGAQAVEGYVQQWKSLKGLIDEQRYAEILSQLEYQASAAQVWRDAICNWFLRTSGIADDRGNAGHFPGRTEAEAMKLDGYEVKEVTPWEAASGGEAVACAPGERTCSAEFRFVGDTGKYDVDVEFFDTNNGIAKFKLLVGDRIVDEWAAGNKLPTTKIDGSSSTRHRIAGVALHPGDEIRIEGTPDAGDRAALDYIEIHPSLPSN